MNEAENSSASCDKRDAGSQADSISTGVPSVTSSLTACFRRIVRRQDSLSVSYLIYGGAQGFSGLLQLGLLAFLVRWLPPDEFGAVSLTMVAIPLVMRVVTLGADIGLSIRVWKLLEGEQWSAFGATLSHVTVLSFMLAAGGACLAIAGGFSAWLSLALGTVAAAGLRVWVDMSQVMLRRLGRVGRVGVVIVVRSVLLVLLAVLTLSLWKPTAAAYIAAAALAEALIALWLVITHIPMRRLNLFSAGWWPRAIDLVRVGFPSCPGMVAAQLLAAGDRFVIGSLLGFAAAGIYGLGQRIAEYVVQILFVPFSAAFGPYALRTAAADSSRGTHLIDSIVRTFAFAGALAAGVPAIFAREVITGFAGTPYEQSATIFLFVSASALIWQMTQLLAVYFSHTEQLRIMMWIVLAAAVGGIASNYVAVSEFGLSGAAVVSLVICELTLLAVWFAARRMGARYESLHVLHLALCLFGLYLFGVYKIDTLRLSSEHAVAMKATLWVAYAVAAVVLSSDLRNLLSSVGRAFRNQRSNINESS